MNLTYTNKNLTIAAIFSWLFALALYVFTVAPTFGWGDSADLAMRMVIHNDHVFDNGSRDYILYRFVSSLFQFLPVGDVGTRGNLATAFFGAVSVGIVAFISGYVWRSIYAAYAAGIALTVSHTFWLMAVIAEVYTFNSILVLACYAFLAVWWRSEKPAYLIPAAFFAGLAVSHHASGLVLCATVAPLVLARIRRIPLWTIAAFTLTFALAAILYWQRTIYRFELGVDFMRAIELDSPTNGFFATAPLHEFGKFIAYAIYNFAGFGIILSIWGFVAMLRKKCWEMLPPILWMLLMIYAGVTSSIPDKFNIYVLVYPVMAICLGFGAAIAKEKFLTSNKQAVALLISLAILPPLSYLAAVHTVEHFKLDIIGARVMPFRDNNWYFMWPSKRTDYGPFQYSEKALATVDKNATIIADYSLWRPLQTLQRTENIRPDVDLLWSEPLTWKQTLAQYIAAQPCNKPIYLGTDNPGEYYQLSDLKKHYTIQQNGVVFKVLRPACKTSTRD